MTCSAEQSSDQSKEKTEMPKLDKILYLQAGRCFYCGKILSRKKASILDTDRGRHAQPGTGQRRSGLYPS